MALSLADPRLAAMSRHPSSRPPAGPSARGPAAYADIVGLLTGRWRVDEPEAFAATVTSSPVIAGHAVLDASAPASAADPWTARAYDLLGNALGRMGEGDETVVRAVAGSQGGVVFVEGRAEAAARPGQGPAFALAHLVEPRNGSRPAPDHSWALVVLAGPGGRVEGVVRAVLGCPSWCGACPPPAPWAGPQFDLLRLRLLEAAGAPRPLGMVLPFPAPAPMLGASSAP